MTKAVKPSRDSDVLKSESHLVAALIDAGMSEYDAKELARGIFLKFHNRRDYLISEQRASAERARVLDIVLYGASS